MQLHGQGWTYAAIARRLGYRTRGGAHRAVWRLFRAVNATERAREQERAESERERRVRLNAWCHDNDLIPPDWDALDEGRDWLD